MKKLKNKIFWTIFIILSLFIFGILYISNYQNYQVKKVNIISILNKMSDGREDFKRRANNNDIKKPDINPPVETETTIKKIFLDTDVYTILLDENEKYKDIITHTEDETNKAEIINFAKRIINNHKSNRKIGNLYLNDYSYSFSKNNESLIIISNKGVKEQLKDSLISSLIFSIMLELIIWGISSLLTKWIIKPVETNFNKQMQFVTDASHELKTPLSVIEANLSMYEMDKKDKWLNNVKNELNRTNKLVTNLLDLASVEDTNTTLSFTETNFSMLIESTILPFESIMYEHKIKLEYNIEKDINLKCNEDQIKQVINILIDNAIKHSPNKGKIIINLFKSKNDIILEIKNKGSSIKKGDEERIFERFFRSDESRNRKENRFGLGLAIAKSIIETHKGKISANSDNGYTTFKIILNRK